MAVGVTEQDCKYISFSIPSYLRLPPYIFIYRSVCVINIVVVSAHVCSALVHLLLDGPKVNTKTCSVTLLTAPRQEEKHL